MKVSGFGLKFFEFNTSSDALGLYGRASRHKRLREIGAWRTSGSQSFSVRVKGLGFCRTVGFGFLAVWLESYATHSAGLGV